MAELRVTHERPIAAPAARVYQYIADLREHHPRWLPPNFSDFRVEEGGVGAGTIFRARVRLGGGSRDFRMRVEELEPGRVIREVDILTPLVTTWTITPEGDRCRVRLETVWSSAGGFAGLLERLVAPRLMRRMYADELARLDRYARQRAEAASS
jgi:uncharacterized protein YndB with AHSA1/START domain